MRIGIFGGSFNPVHLGHVALVVSLQEEYKLDLVYVIPAFANPFKGNNVVSENAKVSAAHRLAMCQLAFASVPCCTVLSIEIDRGGISYTIDTVRELFDKGYVAKEDSLFLMVGQDSAEGISSWKDSGELLSLVTPLIARRGPSDKQGVHAQIPIFEVSGTAIRDRVKQGLYIGHLVHKDVYTYIQEHEGSLL